MRGTIRIFLAGDVMTGRGIDQVLPHPSDPGLHETYVKDARVYAELAESVNGPIARPVDFGYVWGDALGMLERAAPDVRIVNLETSLTASDAHWPGKRIHYRMHPADWAATGDRAGVDLMTDPPAVAAPAIAAMIAETLDSCRRPGDLVVVSIHWGANWGCGIPRWQRELAHALVELAGADVIHGHSSHHARGIEIHRGRPIIYGAGDFIIDYEGITGYAEYRGDLRLGYLLDLDRSGSGLVRFELAPFQTRRFSLRPASAADLEWLRAVMASESAPLAVRIERGRDGTQRLLLLPDEGATRARAFAEGNAYVGSRRSRRECELQVEQGWDGSPGGNIPVGSKRESNTR